jgi:hypothetical protein
MTNAERSKDSGRGDWRQRLVVMAGTAAGIAGSMLVGTFLDFHSLWLGWIMIAVGIVIGSLLGRLAARLLFGPSSDGPLEQHTQGDR